MELTHPKGHTSNLWGSALYNYGSNATGRLISKENQLLAFGQLLLKFDPYTLMFNPKPTQDLSGARWKEGFLETVRLLGDRHLSKKFELGTSPKVNQF